MIKSTLWIYGDSFAGADYEVEWKPWYQLLADQLGMRLINLGKSGSSHAYTLYEIMRTHNEWTNSDLVIVTMTKVERTWLIEELPQIGSLSTLESVLKHYNDYEIFRKNKKKTEAVVQYYTELFNEKQQRTNSQAFLFSINYLGRKLKNKPLVFPSSNDILEENFIWPEGIFTIDRSLYSYSLEEFLDPALEYIYMKNTGMDMRCNHFIQDNHRRLVNSFISYIESGSFEINLIKGIITLETMMDPIFRKEQFATLSDVEIKGMQSASREYRKNISSE